MMPTFGVGMLLTPRYARIRGSAYPVGRWFTDVLLLLCCAAALGACGQIGDEVSLFRASEPSQRARMITRRASTAGVTVAAAAAAHHSKV